MMQRDRETVAEYEREMEGANKGSAGIQAGRESSEGMLRRQIAQLEYRLANRRALLELVLKSSPLQEGTDQAMLALLYREPPGLDY